MPNIFSIIFRLRANYSPLLSLRKTSLSLQPITTLHFLSHNVATHVATPRKNKQKLSEIRPKNFPRFGKKLQRFWKNLPRFSRNVGRFLLSLEEMKTKLRCLSSTPRKEESKVVNQQILKYYSHARTPTRITAIFVFLLSQPSQKSLQRSMFQFIARTFRTYFNIFWKTPRFFLLMSVPYSIAKLLIFSSKCPPKLPLV